MMITLGTSFFLLVACDHSQFNLNTLQTIEKATEKNERIVNALFKTNLSIKSKSEESIEKSKQNDTDDLIIQSLENHLNYIEETNYEHNTVTYDISSSSYLTSVSFESTVSPPNEAPFTLINSHHLMEYNSKDTERFIPVIVN